MSSEARGGGLLAVIPARGGSKRLPGKNLRELNGLPLIAWTIRAALEASVVDEVMVTTDSPEIARVAEAHGAHVPFLRPPELAADTSSAIDVVRHALEFYQRSLATSFELTLLLQPTSPLRNASDVETAVRLLHEKSADAVVSVCEMQHSPLWANTLPDDLSMEGFLGPGVGTRRSQDLPVYYRINGAIYLCRTDRLLQEGTFFLSDRIYAHIMPTERSVDIDRDIDFAFAEYLVGRSQAR